VPRQSRSRQAGTEGKNAVTTKHRAILSLSGASTLCAFVAFVLIGFMPYAYHTVDVTAADSSGQNTQAVPGSAHSQSAFQVNGWKVIPVLAAPAVGTGYLLFAASRRRYGEASERTTLWLLILALFAFCVITLASIGIAFVPAAVLAAAAGLVMGRPTIARPPRARREQADGRRSGNRGARPQRNRR